MPKKYDVSPRPLGTRRYDPMPTAAEPHAFERSAGDAEICRCGAYYTNRKVHPHGYAAVPKRAATAHPEPLLTPADVLRGAAAVLEAHPAASNPITQLTSHAAWLRNVADELDVHNDGPNLEEQGYRAPPVESVAAYYERKLETPLIDTTPNRNKSLITDPKFLVTSGCGVEAVRAIDSGARMIKHIREAWGFHRPSMVADVQDIVRAIIEVQMYG